MAVKRAQNKVAESRFTLPVTALYAAIVFLACGLIRDNLWVQVSCLVVATYLLVELNNANSLIRVYSRLLPCSFLMLTMAANILLRATGAPLVQLCLIASYALFFSSYQDRAAVGHIFYSFACLGIASIFFVQVLYFIPVIWILMKFKVMTMSGRTFLASIIGLVIPYWFLGGYLVYTGGANWLLGHFSEIAIFDKPFDYSALNECQVITFAFVLILSLTGIIHFLRHSYNDKIRVRMLYETFIIMDICGMLFLVLQPRHFDTLIGITIVNTAPLIAHFIALTHTRLTNIAFYVIILAAIALTAYNTWGHSPIF